MATALKVKAKKPGYRRAGYKFDSETATEIQLKDLSKEQIAALKEDPGLLVSEIEVKAVKAEGGTDDEAARAEAVAYLTARGVSFQPNIGMAKLQAKVAEAKEAEAKEAADKE